MTHHHKVQLYARITSVVYLSVYAVGALALALWLLTLLVQPLGFSLNASGSTLVVATAPQPTFAEGARVAIAHPEGAAHHVRTGVITEATREGGALHYIVGNSTSIPSHAVVGGIAFTIPLAGLLIAALATLPGMLAFLGTPVLLFAATQFFLKQSTVRGTRTHEQPRRDNSYTWSNLKARIRAWHEARQSRRQQVAAMRANNAPEMTAAETHIALDDTASSAEEPAEAETPPHQHEVCGAVVRLARRTQRRIHPQLSY